MFVRGCGKEPVGDQGLLKDVIVFIRRKLKIEQMFQNEWTHGKIVKFAFGLIGNSHHGEGHVEGDSELFSAVNVAERRRVGDY